MSIIRCYRNNKEGFKNGNNGFCFTGDDGYTNAEDQRIYVNVKGSAGKNTGSAARSAIAAAVKKGYSLSEIGKAANRSPSVISAIKSGDISNPPSELIAAIKSLKSKNEKI